MTGASLPISSIGLTAAFDGFAPEARDATDLVTIADAHRRALDRLLDDA